MPKNSLARRFLWISSRCWLVGGLGLTLVGIGFGINTALFLRRCVSADGVVAALHPVRDAENGSTTYSPTFRFNSPDGATYTITSSTSSNPPEFAVGQHVRVLYLASKPANARIDSFTQLWFMAIALTAGGVLLALLGYILLRYERRVNRLVVTTNSELRTAN
jgi:hypothetical protein